MAFELPEDPQERRISLPAFRSCRRDTSRRAGGHVPLDARHRTQLEPEHNGKVALMRDEEVVGIYGDCESAFAAGMELYGRGEFSYQEIGAEPVFVSTLSFGEPT